jgi:cell wall-associated NlpC family hydrolase
MSTERPHPTPHRLRRRTAALAALVVSSAALSLAPVTPAGAQTAGPADPSPTAQVATVEAQDAARQVAARRAAQHRLRAEIGRARLDAFLAQVAAEAEASRVAPVLAEADAKLGRPYVYGAGGPNAFDCSGFTAWAWKAAGVSLPHYTGAQWARSQRISIDELQPGDLVFYWEGSQRGDPGHVGLYVGDGQMIHAPGTGRSVRYESIWYWSGATVAAGRVA